MTIVHSTKDSRDIGGIKQVFVYLHLIKISWHVEPGSDKIEFQGYNQILEG